MADGSHMGKIMDKEQEWLLKTMAIIIKEGMETSRKIGNNDERKGYRDGILRAVHLLGCYSDLPKSVQDLISAMYINLH